MEHRCSEVSVEICENPWFSCLTFSAVFCGLLRFPSPSEKNRESQRGVAVNENRTVRGPPGAMLLLLCAVG